MTDPWADTEIAIAAWEWAPLVGARPRGVGPPAADEPGLICAPSLQLKGTVTRPEVAGGSRVHIWVTGMPAEIVVGSGQEYRGLGDLGRAGTSEADAYLMLRLPETLFNAAVCGAHAWRSLRVFTQEQDDVLWVTGYAFSAKPVDGEDAR